MDIKKIYEKYGIIVFNNTFSNSEIVLIKNELRQLYEHNMFGPPELTGSAVDENGINKKTNSALWLDHIYTTYGRSASSILSILSKNLLSDDIKKMYSKINPICSLIKNANSHSTLISYYENNDKYDYHSDAAVFTTLSYLYDDKKYFSGGDIVFKINDEEIFIELENNLSIIFPSTYEHMVTPVKMEDKYKNQMLGRFCLTQFLGIYLK